MDGSEVVRDRVMVHATDGFVAVAEIRVRAACNFVVGGLAVRGVEKMTAWSAAVIAGWRIARGDCVGCIPRCGRRIRGCDNLQS